MEVVTTWSNRALWALGKQVMGEKKPLAILVAEENEGGEKKEKSWVQCHIKDNK